MIERHLLTQGPKLSIAARAIERRMDQSARDLNKTEVATPELLYTLLDDAVVVSVFESTGVQGQAIITTIEAVWGRMDGVATDPPAPTPRKRHFWEKQPPPAVPVELVESDLKTSIALKKVIARASDNVSRRGGIEIGPLDLLQALVEHTPSAVQGMFFEDALTSFKPDLKIDKKTILAAIKVRQEIPQAFF